MIHITGGIKEENMGTFCIRTMKVEGNELLERSGLCGPLLRDLQTEWTSAWALIFSLYPSVSVIACRRQHWSHISGTG